MRYMHITVVERCFTAFAGAQAALGTGEGAWSEITGFHSVVVGWYLRTCSWKVPTEIIVTTYLKYYLDVVPRPLFRVAFLALVEFIIEGNLT